MTRRDKCALVGKRASLLEPAQAKEAWYQLAILLDGMGDKDVPKFNDLLRAIRQSTIHGATALSVNDTSDASVKKSIEDVCSEPPTAIDEEMEYVRREKMSPDDANMD